MCVDVTHYGSPSDVLLWLSLCRTLPYQSISEEDDMLKQCSALSDYDELVSRLPITLPDSYYKQIDPFHSSSAASKSSLVPFSLLSLAVGSIDVSEAVSIYDAMMELAIMRGDTHTLLLMMMMLSY